MLQVINSESVSPAWDLDSDSDWDNNADDWGDMQVWKASTTSPPYPSPSFSPADIEMWKNEESRRIQEMYDSNKYMRHILRREALFNCEQVDDIIAHGLSIITEKDPDYLIAHIIIDFRGPIQSLEFCQRCDQADLIFGVTSYALANGTFAACYSCFYKTHYCWQCEKTCSRLDMETSAVINICADCADDNRTAKLVETVNSWQTDLGSDNLLAEMKHTQELAEEFMVSGNVGTIIFNYLALKYHISEHFTREISDCITDFLRDYSVGDSVQVVHLKNRPELNGKIGNIVATSVSPGVQDVRLSDGREVQVKNEFLKSIDVELIKQNSVC